MVNSKVRQLCPKHIKMIKLALQALLSGCCKNLQTAKERILEMAVNGICPRTDLPVTQPNELFLHRIMQCKFFKLHPTLCNPSSET